MFTLHRIAFRADTNEHLSDMWRSTLEIGGAQFRSVTDRNRTEITVLMCKQKLSPLWFSCRRKSYPVYRVRIHFSWNKIQALFKTFTEPIFKIQGPNSLHRFQVNYIKSSNNNGLLFLRATIFMRIRLWVLFKESSYGTNKTIIVTMFLIKLYLTT